MAKIKRNNFLDTVDEVFTDATKQGILHLYADGDTFTGRKISISGNLLFHFGTTGYLGLEQDTRLKVRLQMQSSNMELNSLVKDLYFTSTLSNPGR